MTIKRRKRKSNPVAVELSDLKLRHRIIISRRVYDRRRLERLDSNDD